MGSGRSKHNFEQIENNYCTKPGSRRVMINALRQYFDRIYIVNLPGRSDRRREILAHLNEVHLFPGVRPRKRAGFRNRGVRGCFLSHFKILQEIDRLKLSNALIMEDDLEISPLLLRAQDRLMTNLDGTKWHIVFFGHFVPDCSSGEVRMERYTGTVLGTHFYGVNRPAVEPLCMFLEELLARPPSHPCGGPMSYDGALSSFRSSHPRFVTLISRPSLGAQRSSRSDLSPRWFDRIPLIRNAANRARQYLRTRKLP
jgi:hypothetical protein